MAANELKKFEPWIKWENKPEIKYPGIYLIAITNFNINGKRPNFKDVVYVGMTNSKGGLSARLKQFDTSIKGKSAHSGGTRIYNDLKSYNDWTKKLFVSTRQIKCNTDKHTRKPHDLRNMGKCTALEYEILAEFKEKIKNEPKYNLK